MDQGKSIYAIITCGGTGTRLGEKEPKQFLTVNGRPILGHTLSKFRDLGFKKIIITAPKEWQEKTHEIANNEIPNESFQIVEGGETRSGSVKNALRALGEHPSNSLVAIHDGVRPLVSPELIRLALYEAGNKGSAVPVVNQVETVRIGKPGDSRIHPRDEVFLVQTPQCFDLDRLLQAFENQRIAEFTDDAGIYEAEYSELNLIEGEIQNIKITYPRDLKILEALLDS